MFGFFRYCEYESKQPPEYFRSMSGYRNLALVLIVVPGPVLILYGVMQFSEWLIRRRDTRMSEMNDPDDD